MSWNLAFITQDKFDEHVWNTVLDYRSSMQPVDLQSFNSNTVDPIKLLLDKAVRQKSWEEIIQDEIFRQRDKSANNSIGYFHQKLFSYIDHCEVPPAGWDVIARFPEGIDPGDGSRVSTVYVEMKNKHNTMNSASAAKTYNKAQKQILDDDDCACFLVEAIAKRSQNVTWSVKVDGEHRSHKKIRRVSIDRFYSLVTGDPRAFYKVCQALPESIERALSKLKEPPLPYDSAYDEIVEMSTHLDGNVSSALFQLGFSSYQGFGSHDYGVVKIP